MEMDGSVTYLGDGLYYSFDGYQIKLFTTNGITTTNEVFLEPEVLDRLLDKLREEGFLTA